MVVYGTQKVRTSRLLWCGLAALLLTAACSRGGEETDRLSELPAPEFPAFEREADVTPTSAEPTSLPELQPVTLPTSLPAGRVTPAGNSGRPSSVNQKYRPQS